MDSESLLRERLAGKSHKIKPKYLGPIDYKGEKIAQYHNPKIFIQDIIGENDTKQFTSILISGSPGTGKTTLATFIAHELHTNHPNYIVVHLGKKELLNFENVMETLPKGRDIILIFDDVSNIFKHINDPEKRTKILTTLTEARHPKFEGTDRKVVVIANVHYIYSMEKMWRSQGSWKIYTDISNEEIQNFNHATKSKFKHQVDLFASITTAQFRKKKFEVSLTNKSKRTYTINLPFRFIMVYDNSKLRFFLVPQESCNFCDIKKNKHSKTKATPKDIIKLAQKYYGKDGIMGLKLALLLAGQTLQFRNKTVYTFNTGQELLASFDIDQEELALELRSNARIKDTRLYTIHKKKTDFMKDLVEIQKNEGNVTFVTEEIKNNEEIDEIESEKNLDDFEPETQTEDPSQTL